MKAINTDSHINPPAPEDENLNKKLFHHPDSAVARMGDNLAGNTAEEKLLSSRKTLSSHYDSTIFSLISLCQDALRHGWAVASGRTD